MAGESVDKTAAKLQFVIPKKYEVGQYKVYNGRDLLNLEHSEFGATVHVRF